MNKITIGMLAVLSLISVNSHAAVVGEEVQYKVGDATFKGYLAYDNSSSARRPGVLVVHEWWGHNDYARERARMLAKLGYTALALDMYGGGKQASHPKEAGAFSGAVKSNMPAARERFEAARKVLSDHKFTDPARIAAIGYCFGGGIVLEMARMGVDLKGVVSFHGSLGTASPAKKGEVKARVLVLNGEADPFVKPEQITAFKKEMAGAGVDYRFVNYPNAKHAFTNPAATEAGKKFGIPLEYNKKADKKSWKEMKKFLKSALK
ncbi:MAG: dienelactone hydrolase [Thiotrichales bacterium SG8_50]|jgi:dienelactone hydrolase|nr:MAG: dienelactone hydrolase [Thiotrichales bacterium SG8_50]